MGGKLFLDPEKAKFDNSYFAEKLLSFKAFDYQEEVDWSAMKILLRCGRRTGKDTIVVNKRIIPFMFSWWCPVRKTIIRKPKVGVYAPGWEEAEAFMDVWHAAIDDTPLDKSVIVDNSFDIELSNGAKMQVRIASKTSTGKKGKGFDLLYETESAFITDDDEAQIRPTRLIRSAPEIKASVHNREGNHFTRAEDSGLYKVYVWKTIQNPLVDKAELENEKKLLTDTEWRILYEAERISAEGQAIDDKLIEKMYAGKGLMELDNGTPGKIYVGGGDLGRRRDKSTIYILEVNWPEVTIVFHHEITIDKNDPRFWTKVIEYYADVIDRFHVSKFKPDQTGIGDMPVMELKRIVAERKIPCIVEGVDFSYALKHKWEGLINQGILKFERFEIHGPFIAKLVTQLRSIRFDPKTKTYETRGPSPDHVMGLFLAISAVTKATHFFGTASNFAEKISPMIEIADDNLKQKIKTGYALKASELGPA